MNLTAKQKKRLAKEARKLAMECVDGGPRMDSASWCGCACGIVVKRAGLATSWERHQELSIEVDNALRDRREWFGIVSAATTGRDHYDNPTAVVFPLLALADALEESNG